MSSIYIFTCILIFVLFVLVFINTFMKKTLKEKWPEYLINFMLLMIGTSIALWGVNWSYEKETDRINQVVRKEADRIFEDEKNTFQKMFYAVMLETSGVYIYAKRIIEEIDEQHFTFRRFSAPIASGVMENPKLYKYSGNEYIFAVSTYLDRVRDANGALDHYYNTYVKNKKLSNIEVESIEEKMEDVIYFTLIAQLQSQVYSWGYGNAKVIVPKNQKQIFDYIMNKEKYTVKELERAVKISSHKKELYKKTLIEGVDDFWEHRREQQW